MADHLDGIADAVQLLGGPSKDLALVVQALTPQHIEFGRLPATPTEKALEAIKVLVDKIPSK